MRKLPSRYYAVVLGTTMALIMSLFMTAVITAINGDAPDFAASWLATWTKVFPIAWPTVLFAAPLAKRAVAAVVEEPIC